jgi:hypothetical protein
MSFGFFIDKRGILEFNPVQGWSFSESAFAGSSVKG